MSLHAHARQNGYAHMIQKTEEEFWTRYGFLTQNEHMKELLRSIPSAAQRRHPVVITGATGTGKERIARMLHHEGPRSRNPYVIVDCTHLPDPLAENELFGHDPWAFTDAGPKVKRGAFERANGGTIVFDEISKLSLNTQAKLLRAVESQIIQRLGGDKDIPIDVRVISSTNQELQKQVLKGEFRDDLYYRINGISIVLPPLRDRPDDIALLATHFLQKENKENAQYGEKRFSFGCGEALACHPWSGNVRELEHAIQHAHWKSKKSIIYPEDFELYQCLLCSPRLTDDPDKAAIPFASNSLRQVMETHVRNVLAYCDGNVSQAAKILGVGRSNLYAKIKTENLTFILHSQTKKRQARDVINPKNEQSS